MEEVDRLQSDVNVKQDNWVEETSQRWRQPGGEDRTEMKKKSKRVEVNGSAWSTEKKCMR